MRKPNIPKKLLESIAYLDNKKVASISAAYFFAKARHAGQKRLSGSPYILHPLRVAIDLASDNQDISVIIAGLLHDILEDTETTILELKEKFGEEIASIVDGVTKVSEIKIKNKDRIFSDKALFLEQVDNYRKILFATALDPRIMIVKLYDRLDNIRTIKFIPVSKQKFYARETIEIFAPIAERLGVGVLKGRLEDAAFPYAYPEEFAKFKAEIHGVYRHPEEAVKKVIPEVRSILRENKIEFIDVSGRAKFFYSLYKKIKRKGSVSMIYDIIALRIILNSVLDCYKVLGLIHAHFEPLPNKIDDYVARPKENGYQSIHTTVKDKEGNIFEIQIRTAEMHETAEFGFAAHWNYKEIKQGSTAGAKAALDWIKGLEKLKDLNDKESFLSTLKDQLFSEQIFVFTPKGQIIRLPAGSTSVDFAYRIHTDLGHRCVGAKINGRLVPISLPLATSDIVEIIAGKKPAPKKDWLRFVKTSQAKHKIRAFVEQETEKFTCEVGERKIEEFIKKNDLKPLNIETIRKKIERSTLPYQTFEKACVAVGKNDLKLISVMKVLYPEINTTEKRRTHILTASDSGISELKGIRHEYAGCCKPKPTDKLIGYISSEHVIRVHKDGCKRLKSADSARLIQL